MKKYLLIAILLMGTKLLSSELEPTFLLNFGPGIYTNEDPLYNLLSVDNDTEITKMCSGIIDSFFIPPAISKTAVLKLCQLFKSINVNLLEQSSSIRAPREWIVFLVDDERGVQRSKTSNGGKLFYLVNKQSAWEDIALKENSVVYAQAYAQAVFFTSMQSFEGEIGGICRDYARYNKIKFVRKNYGESSCGVVAKDSLEYKEDNVTKKREDWSISCDHMLLKQEAKTLKDNYNYFNSFEVRNIVSMYQQLFADVVAVMAHDNNPKVIPSFSYEGNQLGKWQYSDEIGADGFFGPVRYYIYDEFLRIAKNNTPQKKAAFLDKLFAEIMSQLTLRHDYPDLELEPEVWNIMFITEMSN